MPLVMCPTRRQFPLSYSCLYHLLRHYLSLKLYEGQRYVSTVGKGKGETDICARITARDLKHMWKATETGGDTSPEAHTWAPKAGLTHPLCFQSRNWVLLKVHCHRLLSLFILLGARQEGVDSQKKSQW